MPLVILFILLLPIKSFAVYDLLSIDIRPTDNNIQFCFRSDYRKDANTYLLADINNSFLFISKQQEFKPWVQGSTPPIFAEKTPRFEKEPVCLKPFSKSELQNLSLYAGVGQSLEKVVENGDYAKIFGGFVELPQPTKKWTVMVYIVGSDLESKGRWASQDVLEMLAGTQQANSEVVNLVISSGGSKRVGWQTIKRSFIHHGQQDVLDDLGSKSMAEPESLSDFVVWAKANFPAEHYALILWNHGAGSQGYGVDTSKVGNYDIMPLPKLHQAYKDIRSQIATPLDVVVYDACLMGSIEVAEVTSTVAKAMAGSIEIEPGHGIDYAHLMSNITASPPADGLAFGKVVKNGYIKHAKNKGTFTHNQITYSVFDLSQLKSFRDTFTSFANEFQSIVEESFLSYETLSRGIIRAPGYPIRQQQGKLRIQDNDKIVPIDLYNLLQTMGSDFANLKPYADNLLSIINNMVVDYENNLSLIKLNADAGRVSLDIGRDNSYLAALPTIYTTFKNALEFYYKKRETDNFVPEGEFVCPQGLVCAFAQWLELDAYDILGVEAYYGQKHDDISNVYLTDKSFYQYQNLSTDLELGVDGHKACQYQVCVNDNQCEDISLSEQGNQLLADVDLNKSPAVLSFCQAETGLWSVCSVVSQKDGIWGRNDVLYSQDEIIPRTLHLKDQTMELRQGKALVVEDSTSVFLKSLCDPEKAAISVASYSLNKQRKFDLLCDKRDCICKPEDKKDKGCQQTPAFKAGIILKQ